MATSRLAAVTAAVLAAFEARPNLGAEKVRLGYEPIPAGELEWVIVASDGNPEPEDDVASSEIDWAGLGALARDERGRIVCCALSQTGDHADIAGRITRAFELLAECELAVKADLTLAGTVQFQSAVDNPRLRTWSNDDGAAALVVFDVTFETRI